MKINIPLKQHVGKPCKAIVKVGDSVNRGQLIAVPDGLGANIHSSVYGIVDEINDLNISIKASEDLSDKFEKIPDTKNNLEAIELAGVVGAGGAGFPTHVKLKTNLDRGYVIVNAAECEPIINHNIEYIGRCPEKILKGIKYVMEITNAAQGFIGIKPNDKKTLIALGKACKNEPNISIKFLPEMYPVGDERVIVREILDIELKPGELPLTVNTIVINVETVKNIVEAIDERKPVITKDITVAGRLAEAKKGKVFFDVPIGMALEHYIEAVGSYVEPYGEIIVGGPFTGHSTTSEAPITKTSGGILVSLPFPEDKRKVGFIECECGASYERLKEIANAMNSEIVASVKCSRMVEVNGRYRCDKPGVCPGQTEKVLELKKKGAEILIVGTCED